MNLEILFLILFGLLILSAFFSGAETSIMSVNRYKLKHKSKQGDKSANNVDFLVRNPEKTLGLILLMNNFVNILASAISTLIAIELFGEAGVALSVIILTVTILILQKSPRRHLPLCMRIRLLTLFHGYYILFLRFLIQ